MSQIKKLFLGAPKQSWVALGFLWCLFALNANTREIINRLIPYIRDSYSLSPVQAGYIGSIAFLGISLAAFTTTKFANGFGYGWQRRKVCLIFGAGYLIFTALCGVSFITVGLGIFLVLQFIRGFFSGAADGCEVGSVVEWFPKESSGMALGIHHTAYPWGTAIGGVIVSVCLVAFGDKHWQYAWFIFPVIGIVVWLIWYKLSNSKNYAKFEATTEANDLSTPLGFKASEATDEVFVPEPGLFGRCLRNPNISMTALAAFLTNSAYIGLMFWMPLYLAFVAGYNYATAASLSLVFTLTGGLGQIVWGTVADKVGTKRVLIFCSLWLAVSFFLMKYIYISIAALVIFQLILGVCSNAVYPVMYNLVSKSTEKGGVVTGNGIMNGAMYFGGCVATLIMGKCIELGGGFSSVAGYNSGLLVMVAFSIISALIFQLFTRETNGPRVGKDFALVSIESCNLADNIRIQREKEATQS